jgi:hypothetical protein
MANQNGGPESGSLSSAASDENHRDRRIWWMIVAVGFVVFIGLVVLGRPLIEGRLAAARNLDRATAMIPGTDDTLASIDAEVRASSSSATVDPNSEIFLAITDARSILTAASLLSQTGYEKLTEDEQRRARIVKTMATARLKAIDAAEAALSRGSAGNASSAAREQAAKDYEAAVEAVRRADEALRKQ